MDFSFNETQIALRDAARKFADEEMAPLAAEWDAHSTYPVDILKKAAQLGFAGLYIAEKWSGSGLSRLESAMIFEELATACPSTAAWLSIHNMVAGLVEQFGNGELKNTWLAK